MLIVEDYPDLRELMAEVLRMEGYEVFTAADGREGLEQLSKIRRPCLVILDLLMPVMDGFEFLARLRQDSETASLPVFVVTANSGVDMPPSVAAFLRKPMDFGELVALVAQHCPRASA
ncbi:response regulator [Myxococcus virescens]|uniref:response regulator n=1 Tax=Myxococcus virescens TaxID=83456 RepID=UPI003DA3877A